MNRFIYGMTYDNGGIYEIILSEILPEIKKEFPHGEDNKIAERIFSMIENIAIYFNSTFLPYRELRNVNDVHPFGENKELLYKDYIVDKGLLLIEVINPFNLSGGIR